MRAGTVLRDNRTVVSKLRAALSNPAGNHTHGLPIVSITAGGETPLTTFARSQRTPCSPLGGGTDACGRSSGFRPTAKASGATACASLAAAPLLEGRGAPTALVEACIPERRRVAHELKNVLGTVA